MVMNHELPDLLRERENREPRRIVIRPRRRRADEEPPEVGLPPPMLPGQSMDDDEPERPLTPNTLRRNWNDSGVIFTARHEDEYDEEPGPWSNARARRSNYRNTPENDVVLLPEHGHRSDDLNHLGNDSARQANRMIRNNDTPITMLVNPDSGERIIMPSTTANDIDDMSTRSLLTALRALGTDLTNQSSMAELLRMMLRAQLGLFATTRGQHNVHLTLEEDSHWDDDDRNFYEQRRHSDLLLEDEDVFHLRHGHGEDDNEQPLMRTNAMANDDDDLLG